MSTPIVVETAWARRWRKLRPIAPAAIVAAVTMAGAGIATRANERAQIAALRGEIGVHLERVTGRLRDAVSSLEADARACPAAPVNEVPDGTGPGTAVRWRVEGGTSAAAVERAVMPSLLRSVRRDPVRRLFGPFPAPDGRDYLVARYTPPSTTAACFAGASLESLLNEAGAFRLIRDSVDLRLADITGRVLFESRSFVPDHPQTTSVLLGAARWTAQAQPTNGWRQPALHDWAAALLLGALAGTAAYLLRRRVDNLKMQIVVLYERVRDLSTYVNEVLEERERTEQRALALAQLDGGTGLPNRQSTIQALDLHLSHNRARAAAALTVFVVQLESLLELEKALGRNHLHHAMREAAARLTALVGIGGNIGRIGDIELAFWLDIESTSMEAETLAARASQALGFPFEIGRTTAHVSFGIGLAHHTESILSGEELIEQAGAAAEDAVRMRSGAWRRYEPGTRARKIDQLRVETELRAALEGDGLLLHYQPILEFDSQRLVGFEALIRWQHPLQGLLLPGAFLPVAEHAQMLLEIDRWVMRQAVLQAKQWDIDLDRDYYISINISPQHFARLALVDELNALLREHRVAPKRIRLEIVENALVSDMETAIAVANALRGQGMQLCLDDFGTGYSSLGYLRSLPLDAIKVDRFFVERMVTDTRDFGLVKTIIDLARYLEVHCVVEGVSSNEQHELLSVLTPDFAQGNLYSKPVPAARAEQLLRSTSGIAQWRAAS